MEYLCPPPTSNLCVKSLTPNVMIAGDVFGRRLGCEGGALMNGIVVQLLNLVWFFAAPWTAACQASLSFTISQNLLKLMSIESVRPSNYFFLCCPLLLLLSIFPSIRVFSDESALWISWPKFWEFHLHHQPFQWIPGVLHWLMSFRID